MRQAQEPSSPNAALANQVRSLLGSDAQPSASAMNVPEPLIEPGRTNRTNRHSKRNEAEFVRTFSFHKMWRLSDDKVGPCFDGLFVGLRL